MLIQVQNLDRISVTYPNTNENLSTEQNITVTWATNGSDLFLQQRIHLAFNRWRIVISHCIGGRYTPQLRFLQPNHSGICQQYHHSQNQGRLKNGLRMFPVL